MEKTEKFRTRNYSKKIRNPSSVTDMLHSQDWRTREQKRVDSRLCMLYKIRNNFVATAEDKHIQRGTGRKMITSIQFSTQYRILPKSESGRLWQLFLPMRQTSATKCNTGHDPCSFLFRLEGTKLGSNIELSIDCVIFNSGIPVVQI